MNQSRRRFLKLTGQVSLAVASVGVGPWAVGSARGETRKASRKPNIVLILADDMGIDSVSALNDKCGIPTPHLNALLKQGMNFTDAHSGSAVCTPTRYGILTGRYCWRSRLKRGVLWGYSPHLIEDDRMTVSSLLKQSGYNTACVGKWHLGMDMPTINGKTPEAKNIDWKGTIKNGPMANGFNYFYGISASLDMHPYIYIENDRFVGECTTQKAFFRKGPAHKDFEAIKVLPEISRKAVDFINKQAPDKPFFVYMPLTSPHTPIVPSKKFQGKSGISKYADFLMETDWCVGQVVKALKDSGAADNTLLIFTTDNGTSPRCDFAGLRKKNTDLQNHWRGMKADAFEGGHRVPFIVRWPGHIKPGTKSDQTISLVDIMATCADAAEIKLPETAAEDSVSLMPVLKGQELKKPLHKAVICHSASGVFVVRNGKWKLQYSAGSGGWSDPQDPVARKQGLPKWQLYDLSADPKETNNLINDHPEIVKSLT
ncbi:MAG: arylsulfatase, partial [bacterium]|nr:arylsulfatase [bacterium]